MKLLDINGELVNVSVKASDYPFAAINKSKLQSYLGDKLQEIYPYDVILEEFRVPGSLLKIDFFIPSRKLAFEADGGQHKKFNEFFHGDKNSSTKFSNQVQNDARKDSWCEINNITMTRVSSEKEIDNINGKTR